MTTTNTTYHLVYVRQGEGHPVTSHTVRNKSPERAAYSALAAGRESKAIVVGHQALVVDQCGSGRIYTVDPDGSLRAQDASEADITVTVVTPAFDEQHASQIAAELYDDGCSGDGGGTRIASIPCRTYGVTRPERNVEVRSGTPGIILIGDDE